MTQTIPIMTLISTQTQRFKVIMTTRHLMTILRTLNSNLVMQMTSATKKIDKNSHKTSI